MLTQYGRFPPDEVCIELGRYNDCITKVSLKEICSVDTLVIITTLNPDKEWFY